MLEEILEKSKNEVVNIIKSFNEEGVYAFFKVTSNETILKSLGFSSGLLEVNHKVLVNPESLGDFTILTEDIDLDTNLVKKTTDLVLYLQCKQVS